MNQESTAPPTTQGRHGLMGVLAVALAGLIGAGGYYLGRSPELAGTAPTNRAVGEPSAMATVGTERSSSRVALVIGNSRYAKKPLQNPPNDAQAMAALLKQQGFTVTTKTDLDLKGFRREVNTFLTQGREADLRLFYYSGHGASYDGDNYLLPIGHEVTGKYELPDQAYSLKTLLRAFKEHSGINLVLLDSCRDAPFGDAKSAWEDSKGMKPIQPPAGVLIGYAAQDGKTASDNSREGNSLYTKHLLRHLNQGLELREVLMQVRQAVNDESRGDQRPTMEDEVLGKVYLAAAETPAERPAPVETPPSPTVDHDLIAWQSAEK